METKIRHGDAPFAEAMRSLDRWQAAEKRGEAWVARGKRELDRINRRHPRATRATSGAIRLRELELNLLELAAGRH